jgi:preprotein translocase subunit SecG
MLSILLGLHFALTLAIIGLILLQKHDSDGALGSSGGGAASGMFSVRGQANILTKSTAVLMTVFMVNCLVMAKITKNKPTKTSVIDRVAEGSVIPVKKADNKARPEQTKAKQSQSSPSKSALVKQKPKK